MKQLLIALVAGAFAVTASAQGTAPAKADAPAKAEAKAGEAKNVAETGKTAPKTISVGEKLKRDKAKKEEAKKEAAEKKSKYAPADEKAATSGSKPAK